MLIFASTLFIHFRMHLRRRVLSSKSVTIDWFKTWFHLYSLRNFISTFYFRDDTATGYHVERHSSESLRTCWLLRQTHGKPTWWYYLSDVTNVSKIIPSTLATQVVSVRSVNRLDWCTKLFTLFMTGEHYNQIKKIRHAARAEGELWACLSNYKTSNNSTSVLKTTSPKHAQAQNFKLIPL